MPNINLITGKIRLLKPDSVILNNAVQLVDVLTQNFDDLFAVEEPTDDEAKAAIELSEAFEAVREPLAKIAAAVEAKLKPAAKKPAAADQTDKPKLAAGA